MWKRFYIKPFEASVGIFVIVNGILTFAPEAVVRENLYNIVGQPWIVIPITQIIAGLLKIFGIAIGRSNWEGAGIILVTSLFMIRAVILVSDGSVSLSDINSLTICLGIVASNIVRLIQILLYKTIVIAK